MKERGSGAGKTPEEMLYWLMTSCATLAVAHHGSHIPVPTSPPHPPASLPHSLHRRGLPVERVGVGGGILPQGASGASHTRTCHRHRHAGVLGEGVVELKEPTASPTGPCRSFPLASIEAAHVGLGWVPRERVHGDVGGGEALKAHRRGVPRL